MAIVFDLAVAVFKYLSLPILALTQLSEMSYCAHERKLLLVPIPFLVGLAVAGAMKDTAIELSGDLKVCVIFSRKNFSFIPTTCQFPWYYTFLQCSIYFYFF